MVASDPSKVVVRVRISYFARKHSMKWSKHWYGILGKWGVCEVKVMQFKNCVSMTLMENVFRRIASIGTGAVLKTAILERDMQVRILHPPQKTIFKDIHYKYNGSSTAEGLFRNTEMYLL